MANLDFYQILEIERTATTQDIREAYLKLSRARHPDKNLENPHACAAFQQV